MRLLRSVRRLWCRTLVVKFSANSTRRFQRQLLVKFTGQRFFLSRPGLSASVSTICGGARASPNTSSRDDLIPKVQAYLAQLQMVCGSATLRACLLRYAD